MRELRIPAVSIAVFNHYRIEWAKAYGVADVSTAGTPLTHAQMLDPTSFTGFDFTTVWKGVSGTLPTLR